MLSIQNERVCLQSEWSCCKGSRQTSVSAVVGVDRDLPTIRQVPDPGGCTMCTRGPAIATYDDTLQKPPPRAWQSAPQVGDKLAS